jgi:superfamily II DNA or RNA helicase
LIDINTTFDIAPGSTVLVRGEEWQVLDVERFQYSHRFMVRCVGRGELVRDTEATFFSDLDQIEAVDPTSTRFVVDESESCRHGRLYIEAVMRRSPLPASDTTMRIGHRALVDDLPYQREPWRKAADQLQPRLLVADSVGLGKTIEIGMVLSELARRGRANRVLAIVPRHILDQVQHELWCRFGFPLVRLDTEGVKRIKTRIPANRNPFTYFNRVIVSIDTLKGQSHRRNVGKLPWDVVWIDESHKTMNVATKNYQLASEVAPRARALLLTSATPHNGSNEAFARLIGLLDPTAVPDPGNLVADEVSHLVLRRHKHSPDVAAVVGDQWAERREPVPVEVKPSPEEEAVFAELAATWLGEGVQPPCGGDWLFPTTLLKAALSSPDALVESVDNRLTQSRRTIDEGEREALEVLSRLASAAVGAGTSKLDALEQILRSVGVGPRSATRVVVFSERIATLKWIAAAVRDRLGMADDQVVVYHAKLADNEGQRVIEEFGMPSASVRVLVTTDIASEGVNLHHECHHLVHFDLPWSLITLEQRNGRIDRYGQLYSPEIRYLTYLPDDPDIASDARIVARLATKEHEANRALGDAGAVFGLRTEDREEDRIQEFLRNRSRAAKEQAFVEALEQPPAEADFTALLGGGSDAAAPSTVDHALAEDEASFFPSLAEFLNEAVRAAYDDPATDIAWETDGDLLTFVPPADLRRRLGALPQSYLSQRKILDRLRLTTDPHRASAYLDEARHKHAEAGESGTAWPEVHYLGPQHPVIDWLIDKTLYSFGRNEAPVIACGVNEPVICVQAVWANKAGEPIATRWLAAHDIREIVSFAPMLETLADAGVRPGMTNRGWNGDTDALNAALPNVISAARGRMSNEKDDWVAGIRARIDEHRGRLERWTAAVHASLATIESSARRASKQAEIDRVLATVTSLLDAHQPADAPLIRVIAALVPASR